MLGKSYYLFVEVVAQRCVQLMRGAKPKLDVRAHKFTTIAHEEVSHDLIPWEYGPETDDSEAGGDGGAEETVTEESE